MLPQIKVYEIDYDFIIKNYLDKELWQKKWTLFVYKDNVFTINLHSINCKNNAITFEINYNKLEHCWYSNTVDYYIDNMSIAQINEIPVGTLVTRVTSDTNALSDLFTNTIVQLIKNLLLLIGVIVVMYLIDWRMASIMMLFLPIIAISSLIFRKLSRRRKRLYN